jgi:hypothetical protein
MAPRSPALSPRELSECLNERAPIAIRPLDVESDMNGLRLPPSRSGEPYHRLLVLLRQAGNSLGWIALPVPSDGEVSLEALTDASNLANEPRSAGPDHSGPAPAPTAGSLLSVGLATCANAESVIRCVEAIQASATAPSEVIVVENRPARSTVERTLEERFRGDERLSGVRGNHTGYLRASAIIVGFLVTASGCLRGRLAAAR